MIFSTNRQKYNAYKYFHSKIGGEGAGVRGRGWWTKDSVKSRQHTHIDWWVRQGREKSWLHNKYKKINNILGACVSLEVINQIIHMYKRKISIWRHKTVAATVAVATGSIIEQALKKTVQIELKHKPKQKQFYTKKPNLSTYLFFILVIMPF